MIERLANWRNIRGEHGNTFVFYVILLPVFFACFALAADVSIATYTKTTLQTDLDAAAQSAIAQSNPTANLATNLAAVQQNFVKIYAADRANYSGTKNAPFVLCQGTEIPFDTSTGTNYTPVDGCGWHQNAFTFQSSKVQGTITYRDSLTVTVTEYSKTMFLNIIGIDHFKYKLTTTAHLAQSAYAN